MKCVQFNFSHPVKGHACLTRLSAQPPPGCRRLEFDTGAGNELSLPLEDFGGGKWKIMLEWEYEERFFTHSMEIDLPPGKILFPAPAFGKAALLPGSGALCSASG
jgi:hypothetical protein